MTLTKEQITLRQTGIGASEIGAIVGHSRFETPLQVWLRKTGQDVPREETEQMWMGHHLEAMVGNLYTRRLSVPVTTMTTLVHPEHRFVLATPDFSVEHFGEAWLLQVKARRFAEPGLWGEPGTDEIPMDTVAQCQQEMAVWSAIRERQNKSPVTRCDVAAFFNVSDVRIYTVRFDAELWAILLESLQRFWHDHVELGIPPALDGSAATQQYLARKYPHHNAMLRPANEDEHAILSEYAEVRSSRLASEKREAELEAALKDRVGEAAGIEGAAGRFTWKMTKGGGTDYKGVCESLAVPEEILLRHQKPGFRRIYFAPAKGTP